MVRPVSLGAVCGLPTSWQNKFVGRWVGERLAASSPPAPGSWSSQPVPHWCSSKALLLTFCSPSWASCWTPKTLSPLHANLHPPTHLPPPGVLGGSERKTPRDMASMLGDFRHPGTLIPPAQVARKSGPVGAGSSHLEPQQVALHKRLFPLPPKLELVLGQAPPFLLMSKQRGWENKQASC